MISEQKINNYNNQPNRKYLLIRGSWLRPKTENVLEWSEHYADENENCVVWDRDINIPENTIDFGNGHRQQYPDLNLLNDHEWNNILNAVRRNDGKGHNYLIFDVREDYPHTNANPHSRKIMSAKPIEDAGDQLGVRNLGDGHVLVYALDLKREVEKKFPNQYVVNNPNLPHLMAQAVNLEDFDENDFNDTWTFRSILEDHPDAGRMRLQDMKEYFVIRKDLNLNDICLAINIEEARESIEYYTVPIINEKGVKILKTDQEVLALIEKDTRLNDPTPPPPPPPDDGEIMTDEEYNNLVRGYAFDSPIVKEFDTLSEKIFSDEYDKYRQVNSDLLDKIEKEINEVVDQETGKRVSSELWKGREITVNDNEATKNNLKKLCQKWIKGQLNDILLGYKGLTIDSMEELVNEVENQQTPNDLPSDISIIRQNSIDIIGVYLNQKPKLTNADLDEKYRNWKALINSSNDRQEIDNIKDRVLINIRTKRESKKNTERVSENVQTEGKSKEQLKEQLERLEKSRGQQVYEDNQVKINKLKEELSKKISQEDYLKIVVEVIIKRMFARWKVKSEELDLEIRNKLEKVKNKEIKDFNQVNQAEKEIVDNIGNKGSRKKLDSLFKQAQTALKTGKEIRKVKNGLNNFMSSNDIYERSLLSQEAKKIESYLSQLENYSSNHSQSPSRDIPWTMIISIFLFIVFLIGIKIYWNRKRRKSY